MRNIKLLLEYDGTNYVGWQRQEKGQSIQGEIESVLQTILHERVNLVGAGRTDAGVHARGQVANFRTETTLEIEAIRGGLNALLPGDIVVKEASEVELEFHARYSAKERTYSYLITKYPTALLRNYSWFVKYPLDLILLNKAAAWILGVHDFESFCRANSDVGHHQCNVIKAQWEEDGTLLRFTIIADRFLHGMVRTLVGTMVDVGRGYTNFEDFKSIFTLKNRTRAGMAAPARGLVLENVLY